MIAATTQRICRYARRSWMAATVSLTVSCASYEESGLPGSAASMARNQIMLVMAQPETFGHYRLVSLMRHYPDMGLFVARHGMPEFLAETGNGRQQYFILYYPSAMQAYAARTRAPNRKRLEFAGPYPVTRKERQTLAELRKQESMRFKNPEAAAD